MDFASQNVLRFPLTKPDWLEKAYLALCELVESKRKVYVCGVTGIGRSLVLASLYLQRRRGISLSESIAWLERANPEARFARPHLTVYFSGDKKDFL